LKKVWKKDSKIDPKGRKFCIFIKAGNGKFGSDKERMTEKRNQRELVWIQTGGALNFITAAPHCGFLLLTLYSLFA
jgi:hypothetical protein